MLRCIHNDTKAQVIAIWHLYYKTELSGKDRSRLSQAMRIAETGTCYKRHGAILTSGSRVLSVGINTYKNMPDIVEDAKEEFSVHAEIAALKAYGRPVKNGTMYIARIGRRGAPLMSKPCVNCQQALKDAGVRKVVYTIDNEMEI